MTDLFPTLISKFGKLVENNPPVKSIQKELDEIKEAAKNNSLLTGRQSSAVIDRVNNYVAGRYGKSKI
jgi:hypothetical protein